MVYMVWFIFNHYVKVPKHYISHRKMPKYYLSIITLLCRPANQLKVFRSNTHLERSEKQCAKVSLHVHSSRRTVGCCSVQLQAAEAPPHHLFSHPPTACTPTQEQWNKHSLIWIALHDVVNSSSSFLLREQIPLGLGIFFLKNNSSQCPK